MRMRIFSLTSSLNKGNRKFSVGNQESRMDHIQRLVICGDDLEVSDQLQETSAIGQLQQTLLNGKSSDLTDLPSTWRAAAAALPAAARCTSSSRCRRARGRTGWWCSAPAASAPAWTSCRHRSSLRWSPERGCLSSAPSARRGHF